MKKYICVKVDKSTNIVLTEREFNTLESATEFLAHVAWAFGYKPSTNATLMYENSKSALTIR